MTEDRLIAVERPSPDGEWFLRCWVDDRARFDAAGVDPDTQFQTRALALATASAVVGSSLKIHRYAVAYDVVDPSSDARWIVSVSSDRGPWRIRTADEAVAYHSPGHPLADSYSTRASALQALRRSLIDESEAPRERRSTPVDDGPTW